MIPTPHVRLDPPRPAYSLCTLVTDPVQYAATLGSLRAHGFDGPDCEYLHIDNTAGNALDAYAGLNLFLARATGRTVILCHQDIALTTHGRSALDAILAGMDLHDPSWAVLGSAGARMDGTLAVCMTDPNNPTLARIDLPTRVCSLDEAFIVVRADANLALSRDLRGFHLYGTDLCLVADVLGWTSYVVDFPLHHLSPGRMSAGFDAVRTAMIEKYRRALRSRLMATTCTTMPLTGSPTLRQLGRSTKGQGVWRWLVRHGLA